MKNKKRVIIIASLIICFLPFTVSQLLSSADEDDIMLENSAYKELENELVSLQNDEQHLAEEIKRLNSPKPIEAAKKEPNGEPDFDPAIAPGQVSLQILTPDGQEPDFPVTAKFIGVGDKIIHQPADSNGLVDVMLMTGRYNVEIETDEGHYTWEDNTGPAFYVLANTEKDLGSYRLKRK